MQPQEHPSDAEDLCDARTSDTLTEACGRLVDISRKADDLRGEIIGRDSRYERAYYSEHHKLLLITAVQKTLLAENERLKHEIEYLRQSALPKKICRLRDQELETQATR